MAATHVQEKARALEFARRQAKEYQQTIIVYYDKNSLRYGVAPAVWYKRLPKGWKLVKKVKP